MQVPLAPPELQVTPNRRAECPPSIDMYSASTWVSEFVVFSKHMHSFGPACRTGCLGVTSGSECLWTSPQKAWFKWSVLVNLFIFWYMSQSTILHLVGPMPQLNLESFLRVVRVDLLQGWDI